MNDTPKTDANCGWPWGHHGRIECSDLRWSPDGPFVHSSVARELERENAALRAAIGESEEFARKNGETAGAKIKELLRENAALQEALACLLDWGLQPLDYWRDQTKDRFIADIQKASNLLKRKEAQP